MHASIIGQPNMFSLVVVCIQYYTSALVPLEPKELGHTQREKEEIPIARLKLGPLPRQHWT